MIPCKKDQHGGVFNYFSVIVTGDRQHKNESSLSDQVIFTQVHVKLQLFFEDTNILPVRHCYRSGENESQTLPNAIFFFV